MEKHYTHKHKTVASPDYKGKEKDREGKNMSKRYLNDLSTKEF